MDTKSPTLRGGVVDPPSLGERLSVAFAVFVAWLFGWLFVGLLMVFALPVSELAPLLYYGLVGGYAVLGVGATCYVFANPRRQKVSKQG